MREERRRFPRVRISVEVQGKHSDRSLIKASSFDISEAGIRLFLSEELPKGKVMELEINLPFPPVIARGEVMWTKEVETKEGKFFQTGIDFTEMKPADKAKIEAFVHNIMQAAKI